MIRINNIKMPVSYKEQNLEKEIGARLKTKKSFTYTYAKKSIDDRERNNVKYIISVDVKIDDEANVLKKVHSNNVMLIKREKYIYPKSGSLAMDYAPIIIGTGPAGLFAGLYLARAGYKPRLFERGMDVDSRQQAVNDYWEGKAPLNPESNVQFGEGGAGTFSDGKLNTGIKDKAARRTLVMDMFIESGANPEIAYINKPHLGTDTLRKIVKNIRNEIISLGGTVEFLSTFTGYELVNENLVSCTIKQQDKEIALYTNALVLAIGHSARDTFKALYSQGVPMTQKPFAAGVRVEHKRETIDKGKYGDNPAYKELLPAADYKYTHQAKNGRSVYTFCMCPGGYVVDSSSEPGCMTVNGMSYSGRNGENSNSAVVVNVTPEDFPSKHPLAGIELQRSMEAEAYKAAGGRMPVQRFEDFCNDKMTLKCGRITPENKGSWGFGKVNSCLPEYIKNAIIEGVLSFDKYMPGYADSDTLITGVETRTSSPVKILRGEKLTISGTPVYPCGEGAGYAGGITSAAVDGIKVAEEILKKFKGFD